MSDQGDGRPETVREAGSGGRPPTTREGPSGGGDGGGDGGWVPIPGSLQGRYRYIRSLDSGGESNLYLVEDRLHGAGEVLLKLYNTGIVLNEVALEAIRAMSHDHVVRLFDWGVATETGQWFEVQEYLHAGDLSKFVAVAGELHQGRRRVAPASGLLTDVVADLLGAIRAFHTAGLSHHDIKPHNVLVRSTAPKLDLVLGDFGLSIASDRTVFLSKRMGTNGYDSPESLGAGQGGPKRDFWAMGMTIAEVTGGRHPFSQPTDPSVLLGDQAIRDHLYHRRPIDLSAVDDGRVRRLCEGLTRYDEENRWGAHQVEEWLQGANPEIVPDHDRTGAARTGLGVEFAGAFHTSRQGLAAALSADWRAAVAVLGTTAARKEFVDSIVAAFGSSGLDEVEALWADHAPGVDRAVIDVIVALDPVGAPPVVKGWEVSLARLGALARTVAGGDREAAAVIEPLYAQHLLVGCARLNQQEALGELDQRWHAAVQRFHELCEEALAIGVEATMDLPVARASLLGALADRNFASTLIKDRDSTIDNHRDALKHDWYRALANAGAGDPGAVLAARLLAQPASAVAREADARAVAARRERLASSVAPVRSWLRWGIAGNVLVAAALGAAVIRQDDLLKIAAQDDEWRDPIEVLLLWAPAWKVWAVVAVLAIVVWRYMKKAAEPFAVRLGQWVAITATMSVPVLVPFGMLWAFRTRAARTKAPPSSLRKWAIGGACAAALVLVGLVAEERFGAFNSLVAAWPDQVQSWYFQNWPEWLRPGALNERFIQLLAATGVILASGFGGAWMSLTRPQSATVRCLQLVGAFGGVAAGIATLPVLLTGAGLALYAVVAVAIAVGVLYLVFAMLADSC